MDSTLLKILSVALDQKTIFLEENDQCLKRPTSYPLIFTLKFTLRQEGLIYIWKSSTSQRWDFQVEFHWQPKKQSLLGTWGPCEPSKRTCAFQWTGFSSWHLANSADASSEAQFFSASALKLQRHCLAERCTHQVWLSFMCVGWQTRRTGGIIQRLSYLVLFSRPKKIIHQNIDFYKYMFAFKASKYSIFSLQRHLAKINGFGVALYKRHIFCLRRCCRSIYYMNPLESVCVCVPLKNILGGCEIDFLQI